MFEGLEVEKAVEEVEVLEQNEIPKQNTPSEILKKQTRLQKSQLILRKQNINQFIESSDSTCDK